MIEFGKRKYKNILILALIFIYIIIYRLFIYNNVLKYAESITTVFSIGLFVISILLLGYRKNLKSPIKTKIARNTFIYIIAFFMLTYGLGLSVGFLKNSYSLEPMKIFNNIFFPLTIIIFSELFRYNFVKCNKDSLKAIIIMTILLSMFEINLYIKNSTFDGFESIFKFTSLSIIPILLKNSMCSYLVYKADYKSTLLYRIIMELYIYVVPIQPNLNDLFESIAMLLLPFGIIISSSRLIYNYENSAEHTFSKNYLKISDIPFILALIVLFCVVFGIGPYKLVGIETGSMEPALNIGDAVIIDKKYDKENLKEGDIIAYLDNKGDLIIHRIMKKNYDGTYITKGDFNNVADPLYVNKEQIQGKIRLKIPFIAYPALLFK
jgi:signal peptidase I